MPDRTRRHRSTLRLLPRPRRMPTTAPKSPPRTDAIDTSENYVFATEAPRAQSLQPPSVSQVSILERHCDSLPADWTNPARLRRAGRRVSPEFAEVFAFCDDVSEKACDAFDEMQMAPSASNTNEAQSIEEERSESESETRKLLLAEMEALRRQHEQSTAALSSALAAQNAHVAELEARVAALQVRKASRAAVLVRAMLDWLTALLIAVFAWGIAHPVGRVWQMVRGKRENDEMLRITRRSWRLSGDEQRMRLGTAAKRVSLAIASE